MFVADIDRKRYLHTDDVETCRWKSSRYHPYINTREDTDSTNTAALGSADGSITELPCRHSGHLVVNPSLVTPNLERAIRCPQAQG